MTDLLTIRQASQATGIGYRTLLDFCRKDLYGDKVLSHYRIGRKILVNKFELEKWIERFRRGK